MTERFLIGYARVSTDDQELRLQIAALTRYGVPRDQIVEEKASGGRMDRKGLKLILKSLRQGDRVVVWKLDRLGRSLSGVIDTIQKIEDKGADLVSLTENIDTTTAMGRFFFHIIAAMAELERGMISERTKAGMAARKAEDPDVKWGMKHWFSDYPKRQAHVQGLYNAGHFTLRAAPSGKHPKAVKIRGMTAATLMAEANAADPAARKIGNAETVRRWLREGAPGLEFEPEGGGE